MSIKQDLKKILLKNSEAKKLLFDGMVLEESIKEDFLSSLISGHHILITGPPGSGKTTLAMRVAKILPALMVVNKCPLHCLPDDTKCPWCRDWEKDGTIEFKEIPGHERVVRIQGSQELVPEDLIGEINPEMAIKYGLHTPKSFSPGKVLKANRGILVIDFIDKMPERCINTLLIALEGDYISIAHFDEKLPLDLIIIATSESGTAENLSDDLLDHFDVIQLDYINEEDVEKEVIQSQANGVKIQKEFLDAAVEIVRSTREHEDVLRGVSTRGAIAYLELLSAYPLMENNRNYFFPEDLFKAGLVALPHRIKLKPTVARRKDPSAVITGIFGELSQTVEGPLMDFGIDEAFLKKLMEELTVENDIQKFMRHGIYDLLLKKIERSPNLALSQAYQQILETLDEKPDLEDLFIKGHLPYEVKREIVLQTKADTRHKLKMKALAELFGLMSKLEILESRKVGWVIGTKAAQYFLEDLFPRVWGNVPSLSVGEHYVGKKTTIGEGKIVGVRKYRVGDRYRDVSLRDTIRETIRNRRKEIKREDIMVYQKEPKTRVDIVLAIDISGTMLQGKKLWYAKKAAGALALASAKYGDRVGVVAFANSAKKIARITDDPNLITRKILDLYVVFKGDKTNLGAALKTSRDMLMRDGRASATRHIILLTDGNPTLPAEDPKKYSLKEAVNTFSHKITISGICIAQGSTDPEHLKQITKIGNGRMYLVEEEEIPEAILREHEFIRKLTRRLPKEYKISDPLKISIISLLSEEKEPCILSEICEKLSKNLRNVSNALNELQKEGIIQKITVDQINFFYLAQK